jgi:hypothetical protein
MEQTKSRHSPDGCWVAGYSQPLSFMGPLAKHLQVEALKSAFALRTHLGDTGVCSKLTDPAACFLDLESLMNDTLSLDFANSLRLPPAQDGCLGRTCVVWSALLCGAIHARGRCCHPTD